MPVLRAPITPPREAAPRKGNSATSEMHGGDVPRNFVVGGGRKIIFRQSRKRRALE